MQHATHIGDEGHAEYLAFRSDGSEDDALIERAREIIRRRMTTGERLTSPERVADELLVLLAEERAEVFGVLFLDLKHRRLAFRILFTGTVDSSAVYPREIARAALELNAAAVVLTHNHPSGVPEPSDADKAITRRISDALALLGVRTLDHIVVGREGWCSLAQRGYM